MLEKGVVMLLQGNAVSELCLLESSNVNMKSVKLSVNDGGLAGAFDVVEAVWEPCTDDPDIPATYSKNWCLHFGDVLFLALQRNEEMSHRLS